MEGIKLYGIDKLIQVAATQLSDQLPESREAARTLALELQTSYRESQASSPNEDSESNTGSWEAFCQSKLSPLSAQAILRVTSAPKEGLIVGCQPHAPWSTTSIPFFLPGLWICTYNIVVYASYISALFMCWCNNAMAVGRFEHFVNVALLTGCYNLACIFSLDP